ncbi:TIGR01777 family oxidoreductase [Schlegelella sp. S2-27]|uniref:TIGR01777 family oxidoreductase n=1 Tax=Caldimonas mangrovi TaxID=2944811 RepID=A0ABT0YQH4_9BURK|nr:TIGR01777 family oxidoreductase [Caldimonas mangrovi]MCM5680507.1 TIGR01777 family oxidoreductase [Caldimonas mangrovi]
MPLIIDAVLILQALLGAFDNLWHHEWQARLPQQRGARKELALHAAREALYGALFFGLAWWAWHGWFAVVVMAVLAAEIVITLADFLEEDRTRKLPPFERWLHAVLTASYGLYVGLMAPVLLRWVAEPSALVTAGRGTVSWLLTAFAVGVWAWSLRNVWAVRRLGREAPPSGLPAPRGADAVLVTGGTGFVGRALVLHLRTQGRRVIVLTRDARQARLQFDAGVALVESLDDIAPDTRIAGIVHLAGARVLGRPWTRARRLQLIESRTRLCEDLRRLACRLEQRPQVLVAASAVGYYGVPDAQLECDEQTPPMPEVFQSELCAAAEQGARRLQAVGLRVVRLRFGLVLGREDGAYPMQAMAARWGLGARLGDGRQPMPWVHRDDAVGLITWALQHDDVRGAVNAVAPDRCDQTRFTQALAGSFGRRAWLRVPAWPLRLLAGEMSTLLLDGQVVLPRRALEGGYRFRHVGLEDALRALRSPAACRPWKDAKGETTF